MSKDLKKRGFRFVGPTICYAFMQAVGMVDDHMPNCFRRAKRIRDSSHNKISPRTHCKSLLRQIQAQAKWSRASYMKA